MRRRYIYLLLLFVFLVVASIGAIEVNAMHTGFEITELPDDLKNMFIANIDVLSISEEPVKTNIKCFDVNDDQLIAIGQGTSDRKTICVYSNKGVFQYGYTFSCDGDFGVEWDENNLNIYFVRSSIIVSVSPKGEVLDAFEVENTIYNNSYVNHFFHTTKRAIGKEEYFIRNNMGLLNFFATSYSQIIVKDSNGFENVIYDVSSMYLTKMIVTISFICIFVLVAMAAVFGQFIKLRRGN